MTKSASRVKPTTGFARPTPLKTAGRSDIYSCDEMGGKAPSTGQPVGSRHRWGNGQWGVGRCQYCGHTLQELVKPRPKPDDKSLEHAFHRMFAGPEKRAA